MQLTLKQCLRPAIFLLAAICIALFSDLLLWIPLLILTAFYIAVDVFHIDKTSPNYFDMDVEFNRYQEGILGDYILDKTEFYGMFIKLCDSAIFVDIKKDKYLIQRQDYAKLLFEKKNELEKNLKKFLEKNIEFKLKKITGIGLVSTDLNQGDVSWEPSGYTLLKGLVFCDE
jgi:hypothetical protein